MTAALASSTMWCARALRRKWDSTETPPAPSPLGEKGESIGTLLGEENKGMPAMFRMMNEARAFVGLQGFAVSTASYMYALDYARTRIQGKNLLKARQPGVKSCPHHRAPGCEAAAAQHEGPGRRHEKSDLL